MEYSLLLFIGMGIISTNKHWLIGHSIKISTAIFSGIAMLTFLFEWTEAFSSIQGCYRILCGCGIFLGLFLLVIIGHIIYLSVVKERIIYTDGAGHTIKVCFGDLLNLGKCSKDKTVNSIVIPVNRCFDCTVDDKLIASSTLHGKALSKLYMENAFSPDSLNSEIQRCLSCCEYTELTSAQKPSGNLKRYPAGTVATVDSGKQRFFLFGLSSFNKDLKASTSKDDYTVAVQKLYEFCDSNAQGGQVFMPIIGTGLSRVIKDKNSALRYLVNMAILNDDLLSFDLIFVIPESERNNISITNI